jgi:hypothetical protein
MKKERMEVRNLILMFSSAVFIAFIAVVGLIYFFGSGTYLSRSILVAPQALEKVTSSNQIEFIHYNVHGKGWSRFAVSLPAYAAFYDLLWSERSVAVVTDGMVSQFREMTPSTLTIFVNEREPSQSIFQQVQFIEGSDIFRIQLRKSQEQWVYFRYPGIYRHAMKLFTHDES